MAVAFFLIVAYLGFLAFAIFAWQKEPSISAQTKLPTVSILISARNEAENLPCLLKSIEAQNYPEALLEVLIVDDRSEDNTFNLLKEWQSTSKWTVTVLQTTRMTTRPKKEALNLAAQNAKGEVFLFTDADCSMGPDWVQSMVAICGDEKSQLVFGPIRYYPGRFLEHMLSLEQAALLGSAVASLKLGIPSMCNGANMAVLRTAFQKVNGFEFHGYSASGDDELLLHKIFLDDPNSVCFVKSSKAIVDTQAVTNLPQLFQQRRRWAGKWEKYLLIKTKLFALFIFGFHLTWIILLWASLFEKTIAGLVLVFIPLKMILEGAFIFQVSHFLRKKVDWIAFGVLQVLYSPYVLFFALTSRKKGFKWKGQRLA